MQHSHVCAFGSVPKFDTEILSSLYWIENYMFCYVIPCGRCRYVPTLQRNMQHPFFWILVYIHQTIRRHIPEDKILHSHCCISNITTEVTKSSIWFESNTVLNRAGWRSGKSGLVFGKCLIRISVGITYVFPSFSWLYSVSTSEWRDSTAMRLPPLHSKSSTINHSSVSLPIGAV
jgi:hypothetical protein